MRRDVWLLLLASMAFATSGPLGKASAAIPAVVVAAARTGLAAIVLFGVTRGALVSAVRALSGRQRAGVSLAGAFLAAHFALFLAGVATTSLAAAVSLISLEPIAVIAVAFVVFGVRPSRRELTGLVIATAGAAVVASGAGAGEHTIAGDLMVLGAVALYGAYVASARGLRDALPALPYAAAVYAMASLVLLPFAVPLAISAGPPPANAALAVIALTVVPTLVGHTLVQTTARHASPAVVALVSPGETIGSLAIGAVVMGTPPSAREAVGAALVVAGTTVTVTAPREPITRGRR